MKISRLLRSTTPLTGTIRSLLLVALAGTAMQTQATIIDWGNTNMGQIDAYNTATGSNTVVDANAPNPQSMIFANNGNSIIYASDLNSGSNVYIYDIQTKTNTVLASGASLGNLNNNIQGLALTPSGNSVLVSGGGELGNIYKVNISTGAASLFMSGGNSVLFNTLADPIGMAFTPSGNLFVNFIGGIDQVNYSTGAVVNTNSTSGGMGQMTYDPTTGNMYATTPLSNTITKIDPSTLAESFITISGMGNAGYSGIAATSNGNLIIANNFGTNNLLEYFTATNTTTSLAQAQGISGILLAGGVSNPSAVPEPGTFAIFGTGILGMALSLYSRKKAESC